LDLHHTTEEGQQHAGESTISNADTAMTDWVRRSKRGGAIAIAPGDRVAYSKQWLHSTGQMTGDAPHARGTVTALEDLGSLRLAVVQWDTSGDLPDFPEKVNVKNLSRIHEGIILDRD